MRAGPTRAASGSFYRVNSGRSPAPRRAHPVPAPPHRRPRPLQRPSPQPPQPPRLRPSAPGRSPEAPRRPGPNPPLHIPLPRGRPRAAELTKAGVARTARKVTSLSGRPRQAGPEERDGRDVTSAPARRVRGAGRSSPSDSRVSSCWSVPGRFYRLGTGTDGRKGAEAKTKVTASILLTEFFTASKRESSSGGSPYNPLPAGVQGVRGIVLLLICSKSPNNLLAELCSLKASCR
ncbi:serine/arginine repetitive matrix protein 1-like [Cavia porcellus]|uniref:serine/arginine repetitive matrix protein 1-like n=1 Tax=Cavia porcellus TaxID=10141 RepID=UPI002FE318D5